MSELLHERLRTDLGLTPSKTDRHAYQEVSDYDVISTFMSQDVCLCGGKYTAMLKLEVS